LNIENFLPTQQKDQTDASIFYRKSDKFYLLSDFR
jgi:hypothetical protein